MMDKNGQKEAAIKTLESKGAPKDQVPAFPVVGIGASAGGIEALKSLFSNLTPTLGAAFVLVQHLQPDRPSMLAEILSRATEMTVLQAEDGMEVETGRVYIIPPDRFLSLKKGVLCLTAPSVDRVVRMPIDFLFRSLAEEKGEAAIGIILSGSGSDGTIGLRAIHGAGGVTMVQEPASATYPQMPENAISTGIVDHVMAPAKIGAILAQYLEHGIPTPEVQPEKIEGILDSVFAVIRVKMGHDFSRYKPNTVARRLSRRMKIVNIQNPRDYVRYLQENSGEVELLLRDLLIKVTSFFRDPEGFKVLEKEILPNLLSALPDNSTIRAWVPGCSTGEEAYSLAMLFEEFNHSSSKNLSYQIFATDIDEPSIAKGRVGFYTLDVASDVLEERLRRFFVTEERGYRIKKELREHIVFAVQDVLKDPPFTKLDLLSCRNLMIYLGQEAQKRLVELFHYSLRPGGLLFLGSSETIGDRHDLFETLGRKGKFFEARPVPRLLALQNTFPPAANRPSESASTPHQREVRLRDAARQEVLDHFSPPAVVVDEAGTIVFFQGQTGRYLQPAPGEARFRLHDMAKEGLRFGATSTLRQAIAQKAEHVSEKLTVKTDAGALGLKVRAKPLSGIEGYYIVVFEEVALPKPRTKPQIAGKEEDGLVQQLEEELHRTRDELQTSIEEYQSAIEEQKSTSEELQSSNEELQSTNEELETSKEELQSINEELVTVNSELEAKIQQLTVAESDMKNLLDSVSVGVIFIDADLHIQRFTAQANAITNLLSSDIGRPLGDIATRIPTENLSEDTRKVVDTLQAIEKEVRAETGEWYLMRIRPYRTSENRIGGAVITFNDITSVKEASEERAAATVMRATVNMVREPLLTLSGDLRIVTANRAFYQLFNIDEHSAEGRLIYEVADGVLDTSELRRLLEHVLPSNLVVEDYRISVKTGKKEATKLLLNAQTLVTAEKEKLPFVLVGIRHGEDEEPY